MVFGVSRRQTLEAPRLPHDHQPRSPLWTPFATTSSISSPNMASLDNANPTIHLSASTSSGIFGSGARRAGAGGGSQTVQDLWAEEGADDIYKEESEDLAEGQEQDASEDIDQEEIFGACPLVVPLLHLLSLTYLKP